MNFKMMFYTIGNLLKVLGGLLVCPLIVSLIYHEGTYLAFVIPILLCVVLSLLLTFKKPKNQTIYAKEGFVITGLCWIIMSLIGCLPFVLSGEVNFIDALFETISGFTTTGASALENVELLSKGMLFWRSFTHWVGGMGVLVFIMAILPTSSSQNIFILRAESPGPQVGKLVSKVKDTTRILYIIYAAMTFIEFIMLLCGGMSLFDSLCNAFATAGTGGFGLYADSIAHYNTYSQIVIAVFMMLFAINFNVYYLMLVRKFKEAFKSEELYWFLSIVGISTILITINLLLDSSLNYTFGTALKDSYFQVSSLISSTGFATTDFNLWPEFSKAILLFDMLIGACAGSTGGGLKVSRFVILLKEAKRSIRKMLHPNSISNIEFEGQIVDEDTVSGVNSYFFMLIMLVCITTLIISLDNNSFTTSLTASLACINNIGPGLDLVGPMGSYHDFSILSKLVLCFGMLAGRLELYPILLLFYKRMWTSK